MAIPIIRRHRLALDTAEHRHFEKFVEPPEEPLRTLDPVAPDLVLERELISTVDVDLPYRLANGDRKLRMWVIQEVGRRAVFPSTPIRVREHQVVHVGVETGGGAHTIHWHGIEPSPMNDGVGKTSFDVKERYVYQFRPADPGLFFFHCHVNTPLHFEMGLFGALIVDPAQGRGYVRAYRPDRDHVLRYDREAVWLLTAHDSRWRRLGHSHALMTDTNPNSRGSFTSAGVLHDWRPDVFTISGAVANGGRVITDARAAVSARIGETVLLRVLNATYATARVTIGAPVEIIAQDGRAYGVPPYGTYSRPRALPAGRRLELSAAQRHDIILRPDAAGTIPVDVEYHDWRGRGLLGVARTAVTVSQ